MEFTEAMIGKPFTWRTHAYGDVAVHVTDFSPNGSVAVLSIDGGPDATPCTRFPELSDGTGFAVAGQLHKRATSPRNPRGRAGEIRKQAALGQSEEATKVPGPRKVPTGKVTNIVRDVQGIGPVAVITMDEVQF